MLRKNILHALFGCLSFLLFFSNNLSGQIVDEKFGKNRVQYRLFDWKHYSTQHFDIYYYPGGQYLAKELTVKLEEDHNKITDFIGYAPYAKTKVFVYNNNIDLNQSNVGLNEAKFDIAGQTNFFKNQIEIAFTGSIAKFHQELKFLIAKNYVNDMLFGGLFSEVLASSYLLTLPEWYVNGIAAYISFGWNAEMDDFAREFIENNKVTDITKLEGKRALLAGQSIWNFISEKYGRINISSVLNLTRIIRNEEKSITNSLGLSYTQFLQEYSNFYSSYPLEGTESLPPNDLQVAKGLKNGGQYNVSISPNGAFLAYSINKNGRFKIILKNLQNEKEKTILTGGIKRFDGNQYDEAPVFDWGDSTTLGIVDYERGVSILRLYNPYNKQWNNQTLRRFEQVNYMDIYPNGKTAVLSVNVKGQSDLYIIGINKPNSRRLTNDIFDEIAPKFIPGSKTVIFSSNRPADSVKNSSDYDDLSKRFNLFAIEIGNENQIEQLTNDFGNSIQPTPLDSSAVYYLSSKSGIYNLYKLDLRAGLSTQVTAFPTSIKSLSLTEDPDLIAFTAFSKGRERLYQKSFTRDNTPKYLQNTLRKQIELTRRLPEKEKKASKSFNEVDRDNDLLNPTSDTLNTTIKSDTSQLTGKLDPNDFTFESSTDKVLSEQSSLALNLSKLRKKPNVIGPIDYEPAFKIDNVTVSFLFDPLFGFSPYIEYQMNDLLENNKFTGGITSTLFNQSAGNTTRFYGEYQYLPRLLDYTVRLERKSMQFTLNEGTVDQQYAFNKLDVGVSYPFSTSMRASVNTFIGSRSFVESSTSLFTPGTTPNLVVNPLQNEFMYGSSFELVYENSEVLGFNIRQGTRGKIALENYNFGADFQQSFIKLSIDLRHYQKIFKEITFATRLYGGAYMGNNTPYFLLGGLSNWVTLRRSQNIRTDNNVNDTDRRNPLDLQTSEEEVDNRNILFHDIVTGLRGFRINELYGSNTLLLTNELRIPLFRALSNKAIKSPFVRNFQLLGFYDIGTAWFGGNPWDTNNSINTETIELPPFKASIQNYKNPWLSSLGVGVSTVLFGYYGTLYYSLPIEDYNFNDPSILLGIGFNF